MINRHNTEYKLRKLGINANKQDIKHFIEEYINGCKENKGLEKWQLEIIIGVLFAAGVITTVYLNRENVVVWSWTDNSLQERTELLPAVYFFSSFLDSYGNQIKSYNILTISTRSDIGGMPYESAVLDTTGEGLVKVEFSEEEIQRGYATIFMLETYDIDLASYINTVYGSSAIYLNTEDITEVSVTH